MKALVLSTVFPSPAAPLHGLFVYERIRHAAALADVTVVAPTPWFQRGERTRRDGPAVTPDVRVERPAFWYVPGAMASLSAYCLYLSVLPTVSRLARRWSFDVVDAHFGYPAGVAGALLARRFDRPLVVTIRGMEIPFLRFRLRTRQTGWALRRASHVIAVSKALAEYARNLGVADDRVSIVGNGVDSARFQAADRLESRRSLGAAPDARWLVSVGHLVPGKGFHRIVDVLPRLRERHGDVRLAIVGGSVAAAAGYRGELERHAAERGVSGAVTLAGPQPPEAVARWMSAADLFVLASTSEGCPNVLWEAQACATPVVTADVGDASTMVTGETGLVYGPPDDRTALADTIGAALARHWSREMIRAWAGDHGWDTVAAKVLDVWNRATAERGRTSAGHLIGTKEPS